MKNLIVIGLLCAGLSGCASVVNGINSVNAALTSSSANQAIANLKVGATAIVCDVSAATAIVQQINTAIDAGTAAVKDTNSVYTVSSILCTNLGGKPTGTAVVPTTALQ